MRRFVQLTWTDIRLYLREPIGTFFTIAFPPLIVVLLSVIHSNDPMLLFGGCNSMDVSLPACTAIVLGIVSFMSIPISISSYRESGVLRRFRGVLRKPVTFLPGARGGVLPVGVGGKAPIQPGPLAFSPVTPG